MITYSSFEEMVKKEIIPIRKNKSAGDRLDGHNGENGIKVFSYFEYNNKKWRVNSDTRFKEIFKAYDQFEKGLDPFVEGKTKGGNPCLELKKDLANKPKHLYIYFVKNI
ncbi:MAG TPA: hypothetical protein ENK85_11950 [Saprospiraceae bacterium]|nr:hypothetical protein [Saprospiraceae bacterium]